MVDKFNSASNDLSGFEILQKWSDKGYIFQFQRKVLPNGKVTDGYAIVVSYRRNHIGAATGKHFIGLVTIVESMLTHHQSTQGDSLT